MGTIQVSYKDSFTPTKTTHLSSGPISLQCDCEIELEEADMKNEKSIKAEFEKAMKAQIESQSKALDTWLKEKNDTIDKLSKLVNRLQKSGAPIGFSNAEYDKLSKEIKQMAKTVSLDDGSVDALKAEYEQVVDGWAENMQKQQPLIAAEIAVKKASIKQWSNKKFRVRGFKVLKAVLVLTVVAVGIAACVASFGTLTPVVAGITVGLVAVSGITSLARTGADIKNIWNMEKRLLGQVEDDLKQLENALGKVETVTGPFAKHTADLRGYYKDREAKMKEVATDLAKLQAELKGINTDLAKLEKLDPTNGGWAADITKKRKAAADCQKDIEKAEAKYAEAKKGAVHAFALFTKMDELGVNIAKVTAVAPSTMLQTIKQYMTSVDGVLDAADMVGGVAGAALGIAST
jgi:chromosome segregation ATPase